MIPANRVIETVETDSDFTVKLKSPTLRYLNEFFALNCSQGMLQTRCFGASNPAKEITEAFGMFRAIGAIWEDGFRNFKRDDVRLIVAGDGTTPRLGATVALRSNWTVISVDPDFHENWAGPKISNVMTFKDEPFGIKRLQCIRDKAEYCMFDYPGEEVVVAFPHSHAPMPAVLKMVKAKRLHVVANPCCVASCVPGRPIPDHSYLDWGIHSAKREIQIWRDVVLPA